MILPKYRFYHFEHIKLICAVSRPNWYWISSNWPSYHINFFFCVCKNRKFAMYCVTTYFRRGNRDSLFLKWTICVLFLFWNRSKFLLAGCLASSIKIYLLSSLMVCVLFQWYRSGILRCVYWRCQNHHYTPVRLRFDGKEHPPLDSACQGYNHRVRIYIESPIALPEPLPNLC